MKPGFYWILDLTDYEGPEIARCVPYWNEPALFFLTRIDEDTIATRSESHVKVLSGPLEYQDSK